MHASSVLTSIHHRKLLSPLWTFCMYESVENELKEDNNGFGYLIDVNISWIFFKT